MSNQNETDAKRDAQYDVPTQQELIEAIEPLMDTTGLSDVLLAVARICNEKAEHLRVNWQDDASAKVWDRAARAIDRFSTHAAIVAVP